MKKSYVAKFLIIAKAARAFVKTMINAETWSIPHLIKHGQTFTHSLEKANNPAQKCSKN